MADDVLASLRPEGGWWATSTLARDLTPALAPDPSSVERDVRADDERSLLACVARGHVRWHGEGTRRIATRSCAHTDTEADITEPVARLIDAGHAQRSGGNQGGIHLTVNGRRRLADLERGSDG